MASRVELGPEVHPASPAPHEGMGLSELFDRYAAYVYNTLRRLGVPAPDVEDATHEVFVQVQGRLADFDSTRPAQPWLFAFAFRVASQWRRRAHRRYETPMEPGLDARDPSALPDEELAATQDRRLVLDALDAVDLDRRAVFVLSVIDGVPMKEIAEALSIPVNTAYSRLRIARAEFAEAARRLRARRGD